MNVVPRTPPASPAAPRRSSRRRSLRLALFGGLLAIGLGAATVGAVYRILGSGLPSLAALEATGGPIGGTLVFGTRGDTVAAFYRERRVNVELGDVPQHLKLAVLSVEDWRFYRHWGVDVWGLARATLANVRHARRVQGASTLTQQLARNLFLSHEQTLSRKIREAIVALRIERTYTKDEIFRMYLNQIYFGEGAHGIEAASRTYFDKPTRDLDLLEAATLAGLPKNPNGYSPLDHPDRARRRRNVVLRTMLDHGVLDRAQFDSLTASPLVTNPGQVAEQSGSYFAEEVRKYLESKYGAEELYGGELRVRTSLDPDLQRTAERAIESRCRETEDNLTLPNQRRNYLAALARGLDPEPRYLQMAVVAMDPRSGRVLAMVGGRSFRESRFNRAVQARRQPGSCFKPFVYAAAVSQGVGPSEIILDTPLEVSLGRDREPWRPQNYTLTFSGPVSVRQALAKSLNIPAVKLLQQVGLDAVVATARRMGIESTLDPVPSLALGTSEVTLLELVRAYAVLANGGIGSRPHWILRVEDRHGRVLERASEYHEEALDPQSAYVVTSMLQSAIDWGTGHNARELYGVSVPAAGKTGTTDDLGDGWFVGYTPDLVVGVWAGFDERRPIGLAGSYIALPPWCDVLREWIAAHPARAFPRPDGIEERTICVDSGKLATPQCPRTQSEIYTARSVPTRPCDLHAVFGASEPTSPPPAGAAP